MLGRKAFDFNDLTLLSIRRLRQQFNKVLKVQMVAPLKHVVDKA
jgi:hypothetical protein